jgi:TrwC relaxase
VLNIGQLRKGGELYYLNSVTRGVEDYYVGSGEAPGYWLASGAKNLGLADAVGEKDLRAVLNLIVALCSVTNVALEVIQLPLR